MAYTNAIFYLDLYGRGVGDAARANLVPSNYANNGAGLVRVTVGTLGAVPIVTGAVVKIASTTSNLYAGDWKVIVVNANTIDLIDSIFTSNPAAKGTCIPFGGCSWEDAFTTFTTGMPLGKAKAGDVVRVSKTPDPVSIGQGTWTNGGRYVTLATPQNVVIDNCETKWTAANANVTTAASTPSIKQGSFLETITIAAAFTTGKVAFRTLPATLDLSLFQQISFWMYCYSGTMPTANSYRLCLCSDANGDVVVDSFIMPQTTQNTQFPVVLSKLGGGNLGANINSIAFYCDIDSAAFTLYLDNIVASKLNGLNHLHLIGKSGNAQNATDPYHTILAIDGAQIWLHGHGSPTSTIAVYDGDTETVETFILETFKTSFVASSTTENNKIAFGGSYDSVNEVYIYAEVKGGYEFGTENQNGETNVDGTMGWGTGIAITGGAVKIEKISAIRYYYGYNISSTGSNLDIPMLIGNTFKGIYFGSGAQKSILTNLNYCIGSTQGISIEQGGNHTIKNIKKLYSNGTAIYMTNCNGYVIFENIDEIVRMLSYGIQGSSCRNVTFNYIGKIYDSAQYVMNLSGLTNVIFKNISLIDKCVYGISLTNCIFMDFKLITLISNITNENVTVQQCCEIKLRVDYAASGSKGLVVYSGNVYLINTTFNQPVPANRVSVISYDGKTSIFSLNDVNIDGNNIVYKSTGSFMIWQTDIKHDNDPGAWKINITSVAWNNSLNPFPFKLAEVAFYANKEITVKLWVKKEHATNIDCKLIVPENIGCGINETSIIKANNTNWEQLVINFTPAKSGVCEIYLESWYTKAAGVIYVGSIEITQV